jgi:hypothetical protein
MERLRNSSSCGVKLVGVGLKLLTISLRNSFSPFFVAIRLPPLKKYTCPDLATTLFKVLFFRFAMFLL